MPIADVKFDELLFPILLLCEFGFDLLLLLLPELVSFEFVLLFVLFVIFIPSLLLLLYLSLFFVNYFSDLSEFICLVGVEFNVLWTVLLSLFVIFGIDIFFLELHLFEFFISFFLSTLKSFFIN